MCTALVGQLPWGVPLSHCLLCEVFRGPRDLRKPLTEAERRSLEKIYAKCVETEVCKYTRKQRAEAEAEIELSGAEMDLFACD